jgi:hypothetical protein
MIDSSGIGAAGGGAESGGGAASDGGAEWWDLSAAPLDQLAPADELPPDLRRPSAAELTAGALAVLRTPGLDPGVHSVGLLARLDITRMSLADRIDAVAVWARAAAWWDGIGQQLLAAVAAADRSEDKWVRDEVAAVLALAPVTAGAHLAQATAVTSRLPAVLQALLAGEISGLQARAIVEASYQLPDELAGALEAAVLGRASEQTLSELKRSLRRAVLRLDPATAEQRRVAARADRHVRIGIAEDGMAQLWALLPAADAQAIHARLDVTARLTQRADPSDSRTRDQLRADALTAAVLAGYTNPEAADPNQSKRDGARDGDASDGGDGAGEYGGQGPDGAGRSADAARRLPREQGRRPGVNVIVGLSTLLGEDDEPAE